MDRNRDSEYVAMPVEERAELLGLLEEQFNSFIECSWYPRDLEYFVSWYDLIDVIVRTDKREAYFHFFHKKMEINEEKKAALYAYWILKFRPFRIVDNRYLNSKRSATVNEAFAAYIICSILFYSHKLVPAAIKNGTFYEKLMYSFRHRNISIDAMLLLVGSITAETFNK